MTDLLLVPSGLFPNLSMNTSRVIGGYQRLFQRPYCRFYNEIGWSRSVLRKSDSSQCRQDDILLRCECSTMLQRLVTRSNEQLERTTE